MAAGAVREAAAGAILIVWVVPGASSTEIKGLHGDALRVRVAAPPAGGKANRRLVEYLRSLVGVEPLLIRGETSRRKTLQFRDVTADEVRRLLGLSQGP